MEKRRYHREKLLDEPKASTVRKRKLYTKHVSPVAAKIHNEARNSDNSGVQAANGTMEFAEETGKAAHRIQKKLLKKQYAKAKREATKKGIKTVEKAGRATSKTVESVAKKVAEVGAKLAASNPIVFIIVIVCALLLIILSCTLTSCSMAFSGGSSVVVSTSYTATDEDILGVEEDYRQKERNLQNRINNIEIEYSGYDQYNYSIASFGHNAHELASYLTVKQEAYTKTGVATMLSELFNEQYKLTLQRVVEVRYRQEERTGYYTYVYNGVSYLVPYTYYVTVAYNYYILNVTLTNTSINYYVANGGLTPEEKERYEALLITEGNKPNIFD